MKTPMQQLHELNAYFLEKEIEATDPGLRRYYSGLAEGVNKSIRILEAELPYEFIRDR